MSKASPQTGSLTIKQGGKPKHNAGGGKSVHTPVDIRKEAGLERDVVNCLSCGKVYDCRQLGQQDIIRFLERKGLCTFCGSQVGLTHNRHVPANMTDDDVGTAHTLDLEQKDTKISSEADEAAIAFKNRLVMYDRESAKRTTVIDDQSDFFEVETNLWLSDAERARLRERRLLEEEAEAARRTRVAITIDLMGRQVLMADPAASMNGTAAFVTGDDNLAVAYDPRASTGNVAMWAVDDEREEKDVNTTQVAADGNAAAATRKAAEQLHKLRATANPDIPMVAPRFIRPPTSAPRTAPKGHSHHNTGGGGVLRVQDDLEDVFGGFTAQVLEPQHQDSSVFDIAPPEFTGLQPLVTRTHIPEQLPNEVTDASSLPKGLVLLRGWLSLPIQQELVQAIRKLGIGHGGFYTPSYGDGRDMHLRMMCLGSHWEPRSHSYDPIRSIDGATPPSIPDRFKELCASALIDANRECMRLHSMGFPPLTPDVCLVNFYDNNGRLRLHQDKDEASASLGWKAPPVVSFSIGDTCDFMLGDTAQEELAKSIRLQSGDVLVFGGSSRLVFHGVRTIFPGTAPELLAKTTGLRPGRINLTFRQDV